MAARSRLVEALVSWIEPADNPAAAGYGVVAVGLLLAAEDPSHETYPKVTVATVVTVLLYWLAHGYAHSLAGRLTAATRWSVRTLAGSVWHERSIVKGAAAPVVALLAAWASGAPLGTAVTAALWTAALALLSLELTAGVRTGLRGAALLADATIGVALGTGLIALKLILH